MNKACLINTLKHDAEFLRRIGIIDYSLLVRKQNMLNKILKSRAEQQAFHNKELNCTLLIAHG